MGKTLKKLPIFLKEGSSYLLDMTPFYFNNEIFFIKRGVLINILKKIAKKRSLSELPKFVFFF